jgi:RNA polymerase sigma-70 factor (ECF subfamily)
MEGAGQTNDPAADREIAERIRAGDKTACDVCVERYGAQVYRLALKMLGDAAEAEDVTQETFLNAFAAIDRFEWRAGLGTWLHRIAYNQVLMRRRKHRPLFVALEPPPGEETAATPRQLFDWCCLPDRDFASAEARAQLDAAIFALPEKLRDVFVLRELEGLSTEEVAAILDLSTANVKVRLHRARLWLRQHLADYFTELAEPQREDAER